MFSIYVCSNWKIQYLACCRQSDVGQLWNCELALKQHVQRQTTQSLKFLTMKIATLITFHWASQWIMSVTCEIYAKSQCRKHQVAQIARVWIKRIIFLDKTKACPSAFTCIYALHKNHICIPRTQIFAFIFLSCCGWSDTVAFIKRIFLPIKRLEHEAFRVSSIVFSSLKFSITIISR